MSGHFNPQVSILYAIAGFVSSGDILYYKPLKISKFRYLINSIPRETVLLHNPSGLFYVK